jgi:TRAP-type C4-dicarboxylate transport system permease small subunit
MDVLIAACPPIIRSVAGLFETMVMLTIASFVAWQSFEYVERIYALGAVSDIARIPTWIPHSVIAIGFAAIALMTLLRGVQRIMPPGARISDKAES